MANGPSFKLKKFTVADWPVYKSIRLEALAAHPDYFSPSKDETQFAEADWKQRLANENSCTFGLYADDELVGLTGVVRDRTEHQKAHLVSSYIRPAYRKQGLSRMFYEARLQWARNQKGIQSLVVDHVEENIPSLKAHQNFGFVFEESYEELSLCGKTKKILSYRLDLK